MSKEINILKSAIHNTLDKLKGRVRKENPIPPLNEIYQWFVNMSPIPIITDKKPISKFNLEENTLEALFFFNGHRVYIYFLIRPTKYRGGPYIYFAEEICFIHELDPEDYLDSELIIQIQRSFDIEIP